MPDPGTRSSDSEPSQNSSDPDAFVADLIDRFAPAYLPQVQGLAVQSVTEVVEAEIARNGLRSAEDVLELLRQTVELYREVARKA